MGGTLTFFLRMTDTGQEGNTKDKPEESQEQENKEENQEETKEENQEETKKENPDDAQWLMNIAKRDVVLKTLLAAPNNTTTFEELFKVAEENHCDVLTAAILSLKRKKVIKYKGDMLLMPTHKDVSIRIKSGKEKYDPF